MLQTTILNNPVSLKGYAILQLPHKPKHDLEWTVYGLVTENLYMIEKKNKCTAS